MKFKILKTVFPEIYRYFKIKNELVPEYRCSRCGARFDLSVSEYVYCPGCGNMVDWNNIIDKSLKLSDMISDM